MSVLGQATGAWRSAIDVISKRPLPFLIATALLTGTDLLLWKAGALDGVRAADADKGLLALFLIGKLVVVLGWIVASLRMLDGRDTHLLALGKRQLLWIGALFLVLPLMLVLRVVLQRLIGTALAPFAPDPRTVLLLGIAAYLAITIYVQIRLMPALVGVLVGDTDAELRWSWRGTRGIALSSITALILTVLPFFAVHFGNNLLWLPKPPAARLTVLAFDGAIMAALILASSAIYVGLYRRARKQASDNTQRSTTGRIGVQPSA